MVIAPQFHACRLFGIPCLEKRETWGTRSYFLRTVVGKLPDATGVDGHHGLAGFAAEGFAELTHVLHDAVDPELPGRVGIGLHLHAELFWAGAAAPALTVSEKELL